MMTCHSWEPCLRALLDGELPEEEANRVREHLADCPACQDAMATIAQVTDLVGSLEAAIEPPPHFSANLQLRLASVRQRREAPLRRWSAFWPHWSRRYSLAGATIAGTVVALIVGAPPRLGAQDLVGKVQESWSQLQSYSCQFVAEGVVDGRPRRFEQRQWFRKPGLFLLETNEHYPERTYVQADRVITDIPGADWRGRRLAIIRPRRSREAGLPFPFGAEWPRSYDVTMDGLIRELRSQRDGQLLGTEQVLGRPCYILKFHTQPPDGSRPRHYLVWVDRDSFLPLKVKSYLNSKFHTVSSAVNFEKNALVPSDTFRYNPSGDTLQIFGEVEPFVFTLPMDRPRTAGYNEDPPGAARAEMARKAAHLPFHPYAPTYLPDGYVLVRVRHSGGSGWLDAYWLNESTGAVIKLLEQRASPEVTPGDDEGTPVRLEPGSSRWARWREVRKPATIQYLAWRVGRTQLRLAAAGVDQAEALRMAASMTRVEKADSGSSRTEQQVGEQDESGT